MQKHNVNLKEESSVALAARRMNQDRLLERWVRTDVGKGLDKLYASNPSRARNTAMAIQMQEAYMKAKWRKLSEALTSANFTTTPETVLKIVRLGVANSCRGDIFTEYPLQSTDDAIYFIDATYEQSLRGATAGHNMYEKSNKYYAGSTFTIALGTCTGGELTYTIASTTYIPINPFTARILYTNTATGVTSYVGADNGANTMVGSLLNSSGTNTINYATGACTVTFTANPAAGTLALEYNYSLENSNNYTQVGTVGINVRKERFQAYPVPLGYNFSDMAAITLETTGLGDIHEMLLQFVGDQHSRARDFKAIGFGRQVANGNTTYTFNTDFAAAGEISAKSHAQNLLPAIQNVGDAIYDSIQRGKINTIVAGSKALTYMKRHDLWKTGVEGYEWGVFKAGKLDEISVFSCPADSAVIANDELILTFKNPTDSTNTDMSIVYGVLTEISAELRYPEFYTVGQLASIEDKKIVNSSYLRLMTLTNL